MFSGLIFFQKKQFKQKTGIASNIKKLNEEADTLEVTLANLVHTVNSKSEELKTLEKNRNALISNENLITERTLNLENKQSKIKKEIETLSSKLTAIDIEYKSKNQPYQDFIKQYENIKSDLSGAIVSFDSINSKTMQLQQLEKDAESLKEKERKLQSSVKSLNEQQLTLDDILSKIDLYTRIDAFTSVGHFETPAYLYETSKRYADEIKNIREKQKDLIISKKAVNYPDDVSICKDSSLNKKY